MKITRLATCRAKPISWVTHSMVMPSSASVDHGVEHLLDHLGIERRGRLVEQHDLRVHAQRAGDRDALLLAAGELARIFLRLLGDLDALEVVHRDLLGLASSASCAPRSAPACRFSRMVRCGNRLKCWNTMPTSRRISSIFLRSLVSSMPSTTIWPFWCSSSRLMQRIIVDLPEPDGPADDDALAALHRQVDVAQHVEIAVPFVHRRSMSTATSSWWSASSAGHRRWLGRLAVVIVSLIATALRDQRRYAVSSRFSTNIE